MNSSAIIVTKLILPDPKPEAIRRERLLGRIRDRMDRRLLVITGGPGYGKTTLLTQLFPPGGPPLAYYRLEPEDGDPAVFLPSIIETISRHPDDKTIRRGFTDKTRRILGQCSDAAAGWRIVLGCLVNELAEKRRQELYICLEDYHSLPDHSPAHAMVDFLLRHLPDIVRFVVTSRTSPSIACLADLRSKQEALELSENDLAFDADEVRNLVSRQYGQDLKDDQVRRLLELTRGWVSGIHLILSSAGSPDAVSQALDGFSGSSRPLAEYFTNEAYQRQTKEEQDFLARSALICPVSAELCRAVLDIAGAEKLLKDLAGRCPFIVPFTQGQYDIHPLYRSFLIGKVADQTAAREVHQKAGRYFLKRKEYDRAVGHFLGAGDAAAAAPIIASLMERYLEQGRMSTLKTWLADMPPELYQEHPQLLIARGRALREEGRLREEQEAFVKAAELFARRADPAQQASALKDLGDSCWFGRDLAAAGKALRKALSVCPASSAKTRSYILNSLGLLAQARGNLAAAKVFFLKAQKSLARYQASEVDITSLENNLALLLARQGELSQSYRSYQRLMDVWSRNYFLEIGVCIANAARVALDVGQPAVAEQWLNDGRRLCEPYQDQVSQAALDEGFGVLAFYQERWGESLQCLDRAFEGYLRLKLNHRAYALLRMKSRIFRCRREFDQARELLEQARTNLQDSLGDYANIPGANFLFDTAMLQAGLGQASETVDSAQRLGRISITIGWGLGQFLSALALAQGHCLAGRSKIARSKLLTACRLSRKKGYAGIWSLELRHSRELAALALTVPEIRNSLPLIVPAKTEPDAALTVINVKLLGNLEFTNEGNRTVPIVFRTRKVAALFAYLLLHRDRICHREELMEALWPGLSTRDASRNLYPNISYLKANLVQGLKKSGLSRKIYDPPITHRQHGYGLSPSLEWRTDVEEMAEAWRRALKAQGEGDADGLLKQCTRNRDLYRGDFLADIGDRWCEELREKYRQIHWSANRALAGYRAGSGQYAEAVSLYRQCLQQQPLSEEVHVELWRALSRLDDLREIERDFRRLKRMASTDSAIGMKLETIEAFQTMMGTEKEAK
ncbi:MAG: BTAD domain-containing putative transcriptional regulator [Candidatus Edwardsbacteria bacterium]|nr:BTAD domain-containing putative transcriptional regulator [Candidatus Edwardsbacteria bacterium]